MPRRSLPHFGVGPHSNTGLRALRYQFEAALHPSTAPSAGGPLEDARSHNDGDPQPPEFATGPAASELAQRIEDALVELRCRAKPKAARCGGGNAGVGLAMLLVLAGSIRSRHIRIS